MSDHFGPITAFSQQLHAEKYRAKGESFREAMSRVSSALTDNTKDFHEFREVLLDMRFLPAGRVQSSVGAMRRTTAYNCFVSGTIDDSFVGPSNSIMAAASEAAQTMRLGGGIGYDFSTLRPRGALIKKLGSTSCGPVKFMEIFDAVGGAVASAGHRRGAQMGVLRVDHPDIMEFIQAKQEAGRLSGFNLSIGITDKFMQAVKGGRSFELTHEGTVYSEVDAQYLWDTIMRSTWDWAEPGVLFIDTINRMNNLHYCENIAATNPCGEQPLPPYGACLLGSFNLPKYVDMDIFGSGPRFAYDQFRKDIRIAVRAMDRVVDISNYPLEAQRVEALSKRRMGLGVTGLANALEALGYPYGSAEFLEQEAYILEILRDESYAASVELSFERGPFPLFDETLYGAGEFIKTLPTELQKDIRTHGIRNSHLTSIAPTGSISLSADNVSSGIEPVFSLRSRRLVNLTEGMKEVNFEDYGVATFGVEGKTCDKVTVQEHLDVLVTAALRVDSAVSKTCNVPSDTSWSDFKGVYMQAWERGAKGCTTYRMGGKREGLLKPETDESSEGAACVYNPETGERSCDGV